MPTKPVLGFVMLWIMACSGGRAFGKVDGGEVQLVGQVDADYFVAQLDQLDPWFEACYVRVLRRDRAIEGVIRLGMRGGGGQLVPAILENGTNSEELAQCVENAFTDVTLVEPAGSEPWDFTAEWPVTFSQIRRP